MRPTLLREFMAIAAVALIVTLIVFRAEGLFGRTMIGATFGLSVLAYAATVLDRRWDNLVGAATFVVAAGVSGGLALLLDQSWNFGVVALFTLFVVWVPWPFLNERGSLIVLWALAVAPVAMLLVGPPLGDLSWAEPLLTGERLHGQVGYNEIGIPAGLSVIAALALRLNRDQWITYGLQVVLLVLVAGAGTRVVLPGLLLAALWWVRGSRKYEAWRGWVMESLPWVVFFAVAARPMFERTLAGFSGGGVNAASSGRLEILSAYWVEARTALLTGRGVGTTDELWLNAQVDTTWLPHNGIMTLLIDVGIPATILVLIGLGTYVWIRASETNGDARWLLRIPLLVFLPALFMFDHALIKAFLTVPIMVFSAATPALSSALSHESRFARRRDSTPRHAETD